MPVFKLDINQTFGGKSSEDVFTNTMHYTSAAAVTAQPHVDLAAAVASAWKKIILKRVRILSLVSTQLAADGGPATVEPNYKVFDQDLVGTIDIADGVDPALKEIVVNYKKSTNGGKSGALYVRGALSEVQYESSSDLSPVFKAGVSIAVFTAFSAEMMAAATAAGVTWVIPGKTDATFTSAARSILEWKYTGLTMRADRVNRKSISQKERELAKQKIAEADRQRKLAERDSPGITVQALAAILKDYILPLIQQYGWPLVLSLLTRRAELRAIAVIINALPQ